MKKFPILVVCCFFLGALAVRAQDIHFSQFYMSPTNLNPAMTGVINGNIRLVANYRNQWASVLRSNSFRTYSVSYDQRIAVGRYDYFGIGGTFWGDRAGEADFATVTGKVSGSYSKYMGGTRKQQNYLVVGAEAGVAQRSIDFINLRWGNQFSPDLGAFDPNIDSGEDGFIDNFTFADLAAGLLWFTVFNENNNFYLGGAFHHLARANQSFREGVEDPIYSRFTVHAGGEFLLNNRFGLAPGVIVMSQGPSFQVNAGNSFKFLLSRTRTSYQAFSIGLWARIANKFQEGSESTSIHSDAAILSTRFDYNNFSLGFSYDINISSLSTASNSNGGFEFGLIYRIIGDEKRGVYCPNF